MALRPFHRRREELPTEIPVFPLPGALLLPGARLPLNIFEPRYLAMVEDALGAGRMFAMIQPRGPEDDAEPDLYDVGCLGRISSFSETDDGRIVLTLYGLNRFRVAEELPMRRGYRAVRADYSGFPHDLEPPPPVLVDRRRVLAALTAYLTAADVPFNVRILDEMKDQDLVNTLAMVCPFEPAEKQALLEQNNGQARADTLLAILELSVLTHSEEITRQ